MDTQRHPKEFYGLKIAHDAIQKLFSDPDNFYEDRSAEISRVRLIKMIRDLLKKAYEGGFENGVAASGGPSPYVGPRFTAGTIQDWQFYNSAVDKSFYYIDQSGQLWVRSN